MSELPGASRMEISCGRSGLGKLIGEDGGGSPSSDVSFETGLAGGIAFSDAR
jgi:hypothetical protein